MSIANSNPIVNLILNLLDLDEPLIPLESSYDWLARKNKLSRRQFKDGVRGLKMRGMLAVVRQNNREFLKITQKGQLKILVEKAKIKASQKWDGKWRLLIFDIPENFHLVRDRFRLLLKQSHFMKLQASVFISPYPLNREAVIYLERSGLIKFIRIMKVEEMDNDKDLRKSFNLS